VKRTGNITCVGRLWRLADRNNQPEAHICRARFSAGRACQVRSEGRACRVHFVEGPACQVRGSGVSRLMLRSGHDKRVLPFSIPIGVDRVSP
jgi:hypothetical protein